VTGTESEKKGIQGGEEDVGRGIVRKELGEPGATRQATAPPKKPEQNVAATKGRNKGELRRTKTEGETQACKKGKRGPKLPTKINDNGQREMSRHHGKQKGESRRITKKRPRGPTHGQAKNRNAAKEKKATLIKEDRREGSRRGVAWGPEH